MSDEVGSLTCLVFYERNTLSVEEDIPLKKVVMSISATLVVGQFIRNEG